MRRLLHLLLFGRPGWRGMWGLEQRCDAAGVHIAQAMEEAWVIVNKVELNPAVTLKHQESVRRLKREHPRLTDETVRTLVRIAVEGMRGEEAGW